MAKSSEEDQAGYYFELSQVGLEMVVPIGLAYWLDYLLDWFPWLTIVGVVVGLVGGLAHIISLTNRKADPPRDEKP